MGYLSVSFCFHNIRVRYSRELARDAGSVDNDAATLWPDVVIVPFGSRDGDQVGHHKVRLHSVHSQRCHGQPEVPVTGSEDSWLTTVLQNHTAADVFVRAVIQRRSVFEGRSARAVVDGNV